MWYFLLYQYLKIFILNYLLIFIITDADKQNAINLFLGNYIPIDDQIPLWELTTDHHLHNKTNQIMKPLRS